MYKLPSQLVSIMRAFVLLAMLMLNFGVAFGRDDTSKTYRCTAKDSVSVQDDGTLTKGIGEIHRKYFDGIVINILTGDITYPSTGIRENRVVQKTGAEGKLAIPPYRFSKVCWLTRQRKAFAAVAA